MFSYNIFNFFWTLKLTDDSINHLKTYSGHHRDNHALFRSTCTSYPLYLLNTIREALTKVPTVHPYSPSCACPRSGVRPSRTALVETAPRTHKVHAVVDGNHIDQLVILLPRYVLGLGARLLLIVFGALVGSGRLRRSWTRHVDRGRR